MRTINFTPTAFSEYNDWRSVDKKVQDKIADLIEDILKTPYSGIGKPEPLKYHLKGFWSLRINHEHRLIHEVTDTAITIIQCKEHY